MDLKNLELEAIKAIEEVNSIHKLNEVKSIFLGKKSKLQEVMKRMKDLSIEEKKALGIEINQYKNKIETLINEKKEKLDQEEVLKKLESEAIDVTLPGKKFSRGKLHPLTQVQQEIEEIFIGMGYRVAEGPEVELDLYNFEMLNIPKGHPAREMQDTFYIDENTLLRTHTSPVQVRTLLKAKGAPIKIICPGKTYRRDEDDSTHSHQFSQIEGLVVDKNITMSDLKGTLTFLLQKLFGEHRNIRLRPSFFPFVEPGVEVDVSCFKCDGKGCSLCKGSGWIEILGAGMVHPRVLEMSGYDPKIYQGFALGMGIERITMLKYGIDDIRDFYQNDIRFLNQF
ncbi:MAG TPA: phenylalanine--tRNA ligase subunit alpha [Acholeplasmataceae bacterium]|jgi:phenylalanyl-tRNA synthetase alpha chain|nr:phenylalanine--tRNA ligase subunit alpha [Acholeplasmataceae bacterium]